jgi:uncharacterized membrane protein YbhN (UPF0104 family)
MMAAAYIFFMLHKKVGFTEGLYKALFRNDGYLNILLAAAFFLFPLNWAFETLKWKFLVSKVEHISFFKAYRGILTGVTFGIITPFSVGDYIGRILQLSDPERIKVIGAIFLSRIAQFFITLFFGGASVVYFIFKVKELPVDVLYIAILASACSLVLFLLFIYRQSVMSLIKRVPFFSPAYKYFEILNSYSMKDVFKVIFYSFLRYLIFSLQFVLLFIFFEVSRDIGFLCMGVAFIFLVKSIVPTILDLGVREAAAVYFFTAFGLMCESNIIYASLTLWIINILIPALAGMLLIFKIKLFTK